MKIVDIRDVAAPMAPSAPTQVVEVPPDPVRDWSIYQRLIFAEPLAEIAFAFGVPIEHVLDIRETMPAHMRPKKMSAAARKELALARLELATFALMPDVEKGNHEAIDMYLKVQKREAALTGLDAPVKLESDSRIEVVLKYSNPAFNTVPAIEDVTPIELHDVTPIEHVTAPPNTAQDIAAARQSHLDANKAAREHDSKNPKPWLDKPPEPKAAPGVVFRTPPTPGTAAAVEAARKGSGKNPV